MRVHYLNCVSTCPLGGALMDGRSLRSLRGRLTCTCLLVETRDTLVLVDTGFGLRDVADPPARLSKFFLFLLRPEFRQEYTAVRQIRRLGYDPRDVRHIALTHLDFDHAGGLDDFPHAAVHMLALEKDYALEQRTMLDRMRFRPQQWSTRSNWHTYGQHGGERWRGFHDVCTLDGLPPEILLVPLAGHTFGHAGVAIWRPDGWLLHAGDAYFFHAEMDATPRCTPGLRFYQWMMEKDRRARLDNQDRLRELRMTSSDVQIFCGHDAVEFERLTRRPAVERRALNKEIPWRDMTWQARSS
jgi:glyoxylase-like metal-dependent hydrolase (beta-lactamase superfamily II)